MNQNDDMLYLLACDPGSIGWNCQEKCVSGYYGDLCRQPCFCLAKDCDPVIGCPRTGSTVKSMLDTSTKHYGECLDIFIKLFISND